MSTTTPRPSTMPASPERLEHRLMLNDAPVCCRLCEPPQRVEVPARVFYRLKDADTIACPNGHQGTLLEYKQAACQLSIAHGPFIRYHPHPADWLSGDEGGT